jgi:hypothetical protein
VPVPADVEEGDFYACLSCYADDIDAEAWNGVAFAAAFGERILAPMDHARELLDAWPYLTRLYTRVSPHEMTTDPTFVQIEGLDDVANRIGAQRNDGCCGSSVRLPGGRVIELPESGSWPAWTDEMPWAERVESWLPSGGLPAELVNLSSEIDALIDAHNEQMPCPDEGGGDGGTDDEADDGVEPDGDGPGDGPGDGGETGSDGGSAADAATGCGCTGATRPPLALSLALVGLALAARRRR